MNRISQVDGKNTYEWKIISFKKNVYHRSSNFLVNGYICWIFASPFTSSYFDDTFWGFWIYPEAHFIYPINYTINIVDFTGKEILAKFGTLECPLHQRLLVFINERSLEENNTIDKDNLTVHVTFEWNESVRKEQDQPKACSSDAFDGATQKISLLHTTRDCSTNTVEESSNLLEILSKDFECFYESKKNTDCVLRVGDVQFPVHRAVLSARSPAFSAMFHHNTTENISGEVNILDIDARALGDVLYYVYSGKVKGLTAETAASLYTVADRYALMELKTECLNFLKCSLSTENVGDAALLAHTHGETELEERVLQFIEEAIEDVLESSQWREFSFMKPSLANKLLGIALVSCRKKLMDKKV